MPYIIFSRGDAITPRRAVVTPVEARGHIARTYFPGALGAAADQIAAIDGSGGIVKRPDGRIIEVRPVSWSALRSARITSHYVPEGDHARILAAFNDGES